VRSLGSGDRQTRTRRGGAAPIGRRVRLGALAGAAGVLAVAVMSSGGGGGAPQRLANSEGGPTVEAGVGLEAGVTVDLGGSTTTTTTPTTLPPVLGPSRPFTAAVGAGLGNGRTRIERSLGCNAGGDADYWHFSSEAPLPAGVITGPQSILPGDVRLAADVHSPFHAIRVAPEPIPGPAADSAFLLPGASRVALSNNRGTVKLALTSGTCDRAAQTLDFDGLTARTADRPGAWTIVSSTGAYRQAQGSGAFDLEADVSPGADNPWSMTLRGGVAVIQPELQVRVVETFWGRDGVDYAKRQVGVAYDVRNAGAGDSFGVFLSAASSPTPGASLVAIIIDGDNILIDGNTPVGKFPRALGDLASNETARVVLKWQLPLPAGNPPCGLVILGCEIDTRLTFSLPDALDVATTPSFTVRVKAPDLPPPA
jgi:hypothetical protein